MVRKLTPLLALALILGLGVSPSVAGQSHGYVVVLHDGVAHPRDIAADHQRRCGARVGFVYERALAGYAAVIPDAQVACVRSDARVKYLEHDGIVSVSKKPPWAGGGGGGEETPDPQILPWGIDRIDADVSSTLAGDGAGAISNVHVYVIDTGIDASQADLNVVGHVSFTNGPNKDCNGHGTHVAGSAAAVDNAQDVVGAAPGAQLVGVKVLGCNGSGSLSGVIKGIDWVTTNAQRPAVANMSLGGGRSAALDEAVKASADSGIFYAVAAGNDGADACNSSPARAGTHEGVMTVAASDAADAEPSWSNHGPCVDVWAPGVGIVSTSNGGGITTMSGTSMAAPHVAGTAALYLSSHTAASAAGVEGRLALDANGTGTASKDGRPVSVVDAGDY